MRQMTLTINKEKIASARQIFWYLGTIYLVFVIYGSLVPLNFRPMSLADALAAFSNIRYLDLGIKSRADWVANILLFIPLAFFWLGAVWPERRVKQFLSSAVLWIACLMLSIGIEFTQLFFPPRTVSQNDMLAEGVGAAIGIATWWAAGHQLVKWFEEWKLKSKTSERAEWLVWLYLVLLFGYNLLPLDLTISPVEIYHKLKEGRIIFIPFAFHSQLNAQVIYELVTDAAIWFPLALLWVLTNKKQAWQAFLWTVIAAIILEGLQLFVYTRVTDITDVLTAMIGGGLGAYVGKIISSRSRAGQTLLHSSNRFQWLWIGLGGFLIWVLILVGIFWYPFNFLTKPEFIMDRLNMFWRVPFHAYYFGTEYRAITEVLHKILFFAPLGIAVAIAFHRIRKQGLVNYSLGLIAVVVCASVALIIELGQVALPAKNPDSTDLVLETLGGGMGYLMIRSFGKHIVNGKN